MGSGYITQRKIEKEDYSPFKGIVDDSLSEVTAEMLDGITSITSYAFYQCANLTSVEIPSSVTQIGTPDGIIYTVFLECSQLASVTAEATSPPFLSREAFKNTSSNLVIYVPAESVNAYKSASGWSNYASKIQAIT